MTKMRLFPSTLRAFTLLLPLILMAQGCSLYLHSDQTQKTTKQAQDDFNKIRVDQYFAAEQKTLSEFASQEDSAVTDYMTAARDRQLSLLVRLDPLAVKRTPAAALSPPGHSLNLLITQRLNDVTGRGNYADDELAAFTTAPRATQNYSSAQYANLQFYDTDLRFYLKARPAADTRSVDCAHINVNLAPTKLECSQLPPRNTGEDYYQQLRCDCARVTSYDAALSQVQRLYLPGVVPPGVATGLLGAINTDIDSLNKDISEQNKKAAEIEALIKKLSDPPAGTTEQDLQQALAQLKTDLQGANGVAKFAGAKGVSDVLEKILAGDLSGLGSSSQSAKSAPGGTKATGTPTPITQWTIGILKTTDALANVDDAFASQPRIKRINSVLIAIAGQRQIMDMANLQAQYDTKRLAILQVQRDALITEVSDLAIAKRLLGSEPYRHANGFADLIASVSPDEKRKYGALLAAYFDSWNKGQIPFRIMQFKEVQLLREYNVTVAAKTARNWQQLLQPVFAELAAYGEGGIPPEAIATLIYNLGLLAAVATR